MNKIYATFLTRSSLSNEPNVFFSLIQKFIPNTYPKQFNRYDDQVWVLNETSLAKAIEYWWSGYVYWDAKSPFASGSSFLGTEHVDTEITHVFAAEAASQSGIVDFFVAASRSIEVDYSFVHLLPSDPDSFRPGDDRLSGFVGKQVKRALPGVPWAACYGKPYVDLFGREALLSLAVQRVEQVGKDIVYCQLTDQLANCVENLPQLDAKREEVYRRLGRDAFYDPQDPKRQGRVPQFERPRVVRRR